jgi:hypothetical protein
MDDDEITNLKAQHADAMRDLAATLADEFLAATLELQMKAKNLASDNGALRREVEKLTEENQRLNKVVNTQARIERERADAEENKRS